MKSEQGVITSENDASEVRTLVSESARLVEAGALVEQRAKLQREAIAVNHVIDTGTIRRPVNPHTEDTSRGYEWTSPTTGKTQLVIDEPLTVGQEARRVMESGSLQLKAREINKKVARTGLLRPRADLVLTRK